MTRDQKDSDEFEQTEAWAAVVRAADALVKAIEANYPARLRGKRGKDADDIDRPAAAIVVEQARKEADRILREAHDREAVIEHAAYQNGYDEGRDVGFRTGLEEILRLTDRIGTVLGQAIDQREKLIAAWESHMIERIIECAERVIKGEIRQSKEIVVNNIRVALSEMKQSASVRVRVSTSDLRLTLAHSEEFWRILGNVQRINFVDDPLLENGDCVIESARKTVDMRISHQLEEFEREFLARRGEATP